MTSAIKMVEAALANGEGLAAEFCNDPEGNEWHALTYGFTSGWMADDPGLKFDANKIPEWYPPEVRAAILKEYHYYNWGWWLGWQCSKRSVQIGGAAVIVAGGYAKTKGWI